MFPRKYLSGTGSREMASNESCLNRLFVQKIRDIDYDEVINQAIQEYLASSRTVLEEFRNYEVPQSRHEEYAREVLDVFRPRYRNAVRNVSDVIKESQNFFDQITAERPPAFPGFEETPLGACRVTGLILSG